MQRRFRAARLALLRDLVSLSRQYIADVSELDKTAKPLYTVESFHDAATVQQMIDQLHGRMAADKYADVEPLLGKMKDYVARVDASEEDRREFLEGFESTLPQTRVRFKAVKDKEHAWLQASIELYHYTLAQNGNYVVHDGNLFFTQRKDSEVFNQKLVKARTLKAEFLHAYGEAKRTQEAAWTQMRLKVTEYDPTVKR